MGNAFAIKQVQKWAETLPSARANVLLLSGVTGSGKSTMAEAIAGEIGKSFYVVDPDDRPRSRDSEGHARFLQTLAAYVTALGSTSGGDGVLLVDDLDGLLESMTADSIGSVQEWTKLTHAVVIVTSASLRHKTLQQLKASKGVCSISLGVPTDAELIAWGQTIRGAPVMDAEVARLCNGNLHKAAAFFQRRTAFEGEKGLTLDADIFTAVRKAVAARPGIGKAPAGGLDTVPPPMQGTDDPSVASAFIMQAVPEYLGAWRARIEPNIDSEAQRARADAAILRPISDVADWMCDLDLLRCWDAVNDPLTASLVETQLGSAAPAVYYRHRKKIGGLDMVAVPDTRYPAMLEKWRAQQAHKNALLAAQHSAYSSDIDEVQRMHTFDPDFRWQLQTLARRADPPLGVLVDATGGDWALVKPALGANKVAEEWVKRVEAPFNKAIVAHKRAHDPPAAGPAPAKAKRKAKDDSDVTKPAKQPKR